MICVANIPLLDITQWDQKPDLPADERKKGGTFGILYLDRSVKHRKTDSRHFKIIIIIINTASP